ncbi:DNA primase family protein, partial [Frigidibacter sp. ROC022]|uniref:DNA primase family protein n=1 Tax=Frigidibacter sp. ROC022 TaxID=2971796 RepID=UPI00215B1AEF
HSTVIAGLHAARLVVGSELPKGKNWDEAVIKDMTGGDRMTANFMRQDYFDFDPQFTLMIAGNNQPSFRGIDEAIRSRVVLVPFKVTFAPEKRDQNLAEKLKSEAPAILRWAIEGALQWQHGGLDVPANVATASAEYFDDEDTLGQFLAEETENDLKAFCSYVALHARFQEWSERQGLGSWTSRTLAKELKSRGFQPDRTSSSKGLRGLRLI